MNAGQATPTSNISTTPTDTSDLSLASVNAGQDSVKCPHIVNVTHFSSVCNQILTVNMSAMIQNIRIKSFCATFLVFVGDMQKRTTFQAGLCFTELNTIVMSPCELFFPDHHHTQNCLKPF